MFIWITALSVLVIGIALVVWYFVTGADWDDMKGLFGWILVACSLFALLIIFVYQINVKPEINNFIQQKAYTETHVSDNAIEDAALTTKKVELNDWLYNAQYWLTYRNGWSLYPDSVLDLKPIDQPMLDRDLQHSDITYILRTGEPLEVKYPERDDVEVVELSQENYAEIVENRSKQSDERKGIYE